jgi:hypothetical protein
MSYTATFVLIATYEMRQGTNIGSCWLKDFKTFEIFISWKKMSWQFFLWLKRGHFNFHYDWLCLVFVVILCPIISEFFNSYLIISCLVDNVHELQKSF